VVIKLSLVHGNFTTKSLQITTPPPHPPQQRNFQPTSNPTRLKQQYIRTEGHFVRHVFQYTRVQLQLSIRPKELYDMVYQWRRISYVLCLEKPRAFPHPSKTLSIIKNGISTVREVVIFNASFNAKVFMVSENLP
jgi:hypothetical protein